MDRETLLRHHRELYRQRRERETPEEREVRLSRRREYYRHRRAALCTEEHESSLCERRTTYSTDASTNAQVDRSELTQNSGSSADQWYVELLQLDHPDVTAKITEWIIVSLHIQNHVPTTFIPHACMHAFSGSPLDAVSICLVLHIVIYTIWQVIVMRILILRLSQLATLKSVFFYICDIL